MALPVGRIWAQKLNDPLNQPTNFASTEGGLIAALAFAGVGGQVQIGPGDFTLTSIILVPDSTELWLGAGTYTMNGASGFSLGMGSHLRGRGYNATKIVVGSTFTGQAVVFNTTQDGTQQATMISDFEINGNRAAGGNPVNAIYLKGVGQPTAISNVVVYKMAQRAITLEGAATNAGSMYIHNCWTNDCLDHGITVTGPHGAVSITRCSVETIPNGKAGIYLDGTAGGVVDAGVWIRDTHIEVLAAGASGILIEDSNNVLVDGLRFFGSVGTGDLIKITGLVADSYNITCRDIYSRFSSVANTINDVTNGVTLQNEVPYYSTSPHRINAAITGLSTLNLSGNLTASGASNQFGTAGVAQTTQVGQGGSGAFGSDLVVNSGNSGTTKARWLLERNAQADLLAIVDGSLEYMQFRHALQWGTTAGTPIGYMTTAGKLRLGDGTAPTQQLEVVGSPLFSALTSGKYPKISTGGLIIDGPTPLAGTKIYWVSDTSGGAINRKLTFTDGILTAET